MCLSLEFSVLVALGNDAQLRFEIRQIIILVNFQTLIMGVTSHTLQIETT